MVSGDNIKILSHFFMVVSIPGNHHIGSNRDFYSLIFQPVHLLSEAINSHLGEKSVVGHPQRWIRIGIGEGYLLELLQCLAEEMRLVCIIEVLDCAELPFTPSLKML